MPKNISREKYHFLREELLFQKERGFLAEEQFEKILQDYKIIDSSPSFMKIILTIGAVLVGLGILSFIASNWHAMGKILKFSLIIFSYLGINVASFKLSKNYPRLGESFLLIGVAIYGAGIFLIGQMFHFGGHFTSAFLMWAAGILPTAYLLRDKLIYFISIILSFVYINGHLALDSFPMISMLLIGVFYYLNRTFKDSKLGLFLINLFALNALAIFITTTKLINVEDYFGIIFFSIGIIMYYLPLKTNKYVVKLQGNLVFGIMGIFLSFNHAWRFLEGNVTYDIPSTVAIVFSVVYVIYLFYLVRQENLIALGFICITIYRYYVDTMYDFMPKSLFFISSGLILLGFGYYIERKRRKAGGLLNE